MDCDDCEVCYRPEKTHYKYFYKACSIDKCKEFGPHIHIICEHCSELEKDKSEVCIDFYITY